MYKTDAEESWLWPFQIYPPFVDTVSLTPLTSFLSTSNEQVYKVFNKTDCDYSRETCDPKVRFQMSLPRYMNWLKISLWISLNTCSNLTPFGKKQFDYVTVNLDIIPLSIMVYWIKESPLKLCGLLPPPDIQHLQCFSSVSWCRVPVCLLWWGDPLPQVPHPVPVLQRLPLLLVRQLCDSPGPGHSVGGFRLVLLGLQEAWRYPSLPHLCLAGKSPPVRGWICVWILCHVCQCIFKTSKWKWGICSVSWWVTFSVCLCKCVSCSQLACVSSCCPDTTQAPWLLALWSCLWSRSSGCFWSTWITNWKVRRSNFRTGWPTY